MQPIYLQLLKSGSQLGNMSFELVITAERHHLGMEHQCEADIERQKGRCRAHLSFCTLAPSLRSLPYPSCIEPMLLRTRCDCKFNGTAAVVQGRRQGPEPAALLPRPTNEQPTLPDKTESGKGGDGARSWTQGGSRPAADSCGPGRATAPVEINRLRNSLAIPNQDAVACTH